MADFGYDPVLGWKVATYPLVLADLQDRYQAETTDNTDVENGPAADNLRTVAGLATDLWGDQLGAYISGFITQAPGTDGVAEGSALEINLSPKIGPKLAATASIVTVTLTADPGPDVNIPGGGSSQIALDEGPWSLEGGDVLIPGGGSAPAVFTNSITGPKTAQAFSTWSILTPVTGWAPLVINPTPATPGRFVETDAEYRQRYRESLSDNLVATVRKVPGVTSASVIEWPYGVPDGVWGLTHWVELLVVGGDDTAVAEAVHQARAKGVKSVGNVTIAVVDADYVAGQWDESFSRPVPIQVWVEITVVKGEGYPGDTSPDAILAREKLLKLAVVAHFALLNSGNDTSGFAIGRDVGAAVDPTISGIADLKVKVDSIFPPVNTGVLAADIRQILTTAIVDISILGA